MIEQANQVCFWSGVWERTTYRGIPVFKYPEDLWTYQEIITEYRPDVIVETGTAQGGSAVYFQDLLDIVGRGGRVVTVDVVDQVATKDPRIRYLLGSSVADHVIEWVKESITPADQVMVILDSEHLEDHVYRELELYAPLVTPVQYLVCEDTFISRYACEGVRFINGSTWEAVTRWLPEHPDYEQDTTRDKHLLSMNPGGWLRRMR